MNERDYVRKLMQAQKLLGECHAGAAEAQRRQSPETIAWQRDLLREANSLVNEALLRGPTEHMDLPAAPTGGAGPEGIKDLLRLR